MTTLADIAAFIGAELVPSDRASGSTVIKGIAPIAAAKSSDVTFLADQAYAPHLATTAAAAVIVATRADDCRAAQLVHKNPYFAFAKTAQMFHGPAKGNGVISDKASVAKTAKLGQGVTIHPFAVVSDDAVIGDRAEIFPGAYVGRGAVIGPDTVLRANAVLEYGCKLGARVLVHAGAVIGADGFGFAPGDTEIAKIPQVGAVVVGDDVEIGPNTTIDRGAMHDTVIGNDTKLDSHVHVAHNVKIGAHTMMCGMSAIAGSATLGDWVIIGGNSCVDGRTDIGDRITLGGLSAFTRDIKEPGIYAGFPAEPIREWKKQIVHARNLPKLVERVKELEKLVADLQKS
jgi:UDP-3-O-[3-hydroxymyristoyl] glucosamine N-acyltransferase